MPRLQYREFHRGVRLIGGGEKVQACHGYDVLDAILRSENVADPLGDRLRALEGGPIWKLDYGKEVALDFHRQEPGRQPLINAVGEQNAGGKEGEHQPSSPDQV